MEIEIWSQIEATHTHTHNANNIHRFSHEHQIHHLKKNRFILTSAIDVTPIVKNTWNKRSKNKWSNEKKQQTKSFNKLIKKTFCSIIVNYHCCWWWCIDFNVLVLVTNIDLQMNRCIMLVSAQTIKTNIDQSSRFIHMQKYTILCKYVYKRSLLLFAFLLI